MERSDERVVVVTGASRGLGADMARAIGEENAHIVMVARELDRLTAAADELEADGIATSTYACNLADRAATNELAATLRATHPRIQGLVNNAGIADHRLAADMDDDSWNRVIEVNLSAVFALSRGLIEPLAAARDGAIVNISSVMGVGTTRGLASYSASKAGLQHLTRALALELGPRGIRVNAVAPGFIHTGMFEEHPRARQDAIRSAQPLGRLGTVDEVSAAVCFLLGAGAGFVTGHTLVVDGGLSCQLAVPPLLD